MQFFCLSLRCFIQFHPLVVPRRKWRNNFSSIWAGTIPTQKLWLKKQSCSEEWKYLAPGSGYHILSLALRGAFIVQVIFGNESPILSQHLISAFASMKFIYLKKFVWPKPRKNMIPFDSSTRRIASASFDAALKRKPQSRRDAPMREALAQKEATAEENNKLEVVEDEDPTMPGRWFFSRV